jgi:hypothetical protein
VPAELVSVEEGWGRFYHWWIRYGALKEGEAQRLKGARAGEQPPEEDRRQTGARHFAAEGPAAGTPVSPARRRDTVRFLLKRRRISERRACRLVGQHHST